MERTEKNTGHSSSRKRLEELQYIRKNRGRITNETLLMNMLYGVMASLIVFILAIYLLRYVYVKFYVYDQSTFRIASIFIILACAAWYYYRIPTFLKNYHLWKERKKSL